MLPPATSARCSTEPSRRSPPRCSTSSRGSPGAGPAACPAASGRSAPRGNLGDGPNRPRRRRRTNCTPASAYLAGRASADFDSLLGGALDITAHRLDAWHTALATRRLGQLRAAQPAQVYLGGFGWVENLVARAPLSPASVPGEPAALQDPANRGYQLAPSQQQAITAAVLRSGFLTNNPPASRPRNGAAQGNPFAVDLSSRRARLATWLLDGVRQGQPLADLLGYRFERTLQEDQEPGSARSSSTSARPSPAARSSPATGTAHTPAEPAPVSGVTDGVALTTWRSQRAQGSSRHHCRPRSPRTTGRRPSRPSPSSPTRSTRSPTR